MARHARSYCALGYAVLRVKLHRPQSSQAAAWQAMRKPGRAPAGLIARPPTGSAPAVLGATLVNAGTPGEEAANANRQYSQLAAMLRDKPGDGHLVQLLGRLHAGLPVAPSSPHTPLQLSSCSSCIMLCLY